MKIELTLITKTNSINIEVSTELSIKEILTIVNEKKLINIDLNKIHNVELVILNKYAMLENTLDNLCVKNGEIIIIK